MNSCTCVSFHLIFGHPLSTLVNPVRPHVVPPSIWPPALNLKCGVTQAFACRRYICTNHPTHLRRKFKIGNWPPSLLAKPAKGSPADNRVRQFEACSWKLTSSKSSWSSYSRLFARVKIITIIISKRWRVTWLGWSRVIRATEIDGVVICALTYETSNAHKGEGGVKCTNTNRQIQIQKCINIHLALYFLWNQHTRGGWS